MKRTNLLETNIDAHQVFVVINERKKERDIHFTLFKKERLLSLTNNTPVYQGWIISMVLIVSQRTTKENLIKQQKKYFVMSEMKVFF